MSTAAEALLSAVPDVLREALAKRTDLEESLTRLHDAGRRAWPDLEIDVALFAAHIGQRLEPDESADEQLARLNAAELYLACACSAGDERAIVAFERAFGPDLDRAVARAGDQAGGRDEVKQRLRSKLFVGDERTPPKIAAYAGRGSLQGWVRVTAIRTVLDMVRWRNDDRRKAAVDESFLDALPDTDPSPELDYLRRAHGARLPEAMRSAFASLTPRQRNLLRQRFLHGLSTEQISSLYGVHRATTFRWIEAAKRGLFDATRGALREHLAVSGRELESLLGALSSRLDVSMRSLLHSELESEG